MKIFVNEPLILLYLIHFFLYTWTQSLLDSFTLTPDQIPNIQLATHLVSKWLLDAANLYMVSIMAPSFLSLKRARSEGLDSTTIKEPKQKLDDTCQEE
jgi:hypothetical protein